MRTSLNSYGRLSARRPLPLLAGWLAVVLLVIGSWSVTGTAIDDGIVIPNSDSDLAQQVREAEFPRSALANGTIVMVSQAGPVTEPATAAAITESLEAVAELEGVTSVLSPARPRLAAAVATDQQRGQDRLRAGLLRPTRSRARRGDL